MSKTNRKNIIQIIYHILVIVVSSIFSGLGYSFLSTSRGDFGMGVLGAALFCYFVGGVVAALFLGMKANILITFGGSILVAILTTILIPFDVIEWYFSLFGKFFFLGALLTPPTISILVYASLRLIKAKQLSIQP